MDEMEQDFTEDSFMEYLYQNSRISSYNLPNADKILSAIYKEAYKKGHSGGYEDIEAIFDELDELVSYSIAVAMGKEVE